MGTIAKALAPVATALGKGAGALLLNYPLTMLALAGALVAIVLIEAVAGFFRGGDDQ